MSGTIFNLFFKKKLYLIKHLPACYYWIGAHCDCWSVKGWRLNSCGAMEHAERSAQSCIHQSPFTGSVSPCPSCYISGLLISHSPILLLTNRSEEFKVVSSVALCSPSQGPPGNNGWLNGAKRDNLLVLGWSQFCWTLNTSELLWLQAEVKP